MIGTRLGSSPNGGFALACFRVFTQVLLTSTGVGTGFCSIPAHEAGSTPALSFDRDVNKLRVLQRMIEVFTTSSVGGFVIWMSEYKKAGRSTIAGF